MKDFDIDIFMDSVVRKSRLVKESPTDHMEIIRLLSRTCERPCDDGFECIQESEWEPVER